MAPDRGLRIYADVGELARAGAGEVERAAREALEARGRFELVLSGGSTPRQLYQLLSTELQWEQIHLWFGDERCVSPEHEDSNYRMVQESLLARIPIPAENVHRMRGEDPEPARAASEYERELRLHFGLQPGEFPRFDLVLLGMGTDGHTASLFPGSQALEERLKPCVADWVEQKKSWRLTLTLPVLNGAARVLFLVGGEDKAATLRAVRSKPDASRPASLLVGGTAQVEWWVDRAAAS